MKKMALKGVGGVKRKNSVYKGGVSKNFLQILQ